MKSRTVSSSRPAVSTKQPGFRGVLDPDLVRFWPRDPEALARGSGSVVFKEGSRSLVFRAVLGGKIVVIKRRRARSLLERWRGRFRASRARRNYQVALDLRQAGIRVPRSLGAIEARGRHASGTSYLVMDCVEPAETLYRFLEERPPGHAERHVVARRMGKLLGRMHAVGFRNRDLKAQNFLVDSRLRIWLVDLDGVSRSSPRGIRSRRARDLARLRRDVEATGGASRVEHRAFAAAYRRARRKKA